MSARRFVTTGQVNDELSELRAENAQLGGLDSTPKPMAPGTTDGKYWNLSLGLAEIRRMESVNAALRKDVSFVPPSTPAQNTAVNEPVAKRGIPVMHSAPKVTPAPVAAAVGPLEYAACALGTDFVLSLQRQFPNDRAGAENRASKALFLSGFTCPGMDTAALTAKYGTQKRHTGLQGVLTAQVQSRIDAMSKPTENKPAAKQSFAHLRGIERAVAAQKANLEAEKTNK